jgi:uncharacterized membrane protein
MGAALVVAALLLAPGAALDPPEAMPSAAALVALVVLGLVCTAARLVVYGMLVAEAGAGRALVITYVNSVVAVALGMIFLGERPGPGALVGLGLILVGSWLATASAGGPRTTPSTRPGRPISSMPPEPPSSAGTPTAYPFASPHLGRYTEEVDITVSQVSDPDDPAFDHLLDIYRGSRRSATRTIRPSRARSWLPACSRRRATCTSGRGSRGSGAPPWAPLFRNSSSTASTTA